MTTYKDVERGCRNDLLIAAAISFGLIWIVLTAVSCLPAGIAKRTYKKVEQIAPYTTLDSQRLAIRSASTFPVKPPITKPGKIIIDKFHDSTSFYKKKLSDVLAGKNASLKEIQDRYKDSSVQYQIAVSDSYNSGFDLGRQVGEFDGRSACPPPVICTPDSILYESPEMAAARERDRLTAATSQSKTIEWQGKAEAYQEQAKNRLKWLLIENILLVICIGLWIYFEIIKPKIPVKL